MTRDVESLWLGDTIDLASAILTLGHIRHLPVTDEQGRLHGLVTHRDLLRTFAEIYEMKGSERDAALIKVDNMMTRNVVTVRPDESAVSAAEAMLEQKIGCMPVVDAGNRVVGIVTEADFVRKAIELLSDPGA